MSERSAVEGRDSGFGNFEILGNGAAGHANRPERCAAAALERDATCEWCEPAVGKLEAMRGRPRLAVFPDAFTRRLEEDGCPRLLHRDVDRPEHRAIHPDERFEMSAAVKERNVDAHAQCNGLCFARSEDVMRLMCGYHQRPRSNDPAINANDLAVDPGSIRTRKK